MFKYFLFIFPLFIYSCEDNSPPKNVVSEDELPDKPKSLEEYAKRHVEATLRIPANEKYSLKIYKENLDGDNKQDAIIAVNRLKFAMDEASHNENPAKRVELGFMGNFNYIFYYDGGMDLISPQINVPSSPLLPLDIIFENVSSNDYKDIIVNYRIRNASYRDYYMIKNHTPQHVFQWKNFDGMGTSNVEAFTFSYEQGKVAEPKNIVIHRAKLGNIPKNADLNTFIPTITATKQLERMFFYLPSQATYVTEK